MDTARKDLADKARARMQVYGLLAAIFRAAPTQALVRMLKAPGFTETLDAMDLSLGAAFHQAPPEDLAQELSVEFTKLFIGPGSHLSPHESIFANVEGGEGGLWGERTVAVKKFIETAGFTYEQNFTGLPDHVSVAFEFMQKLAAAEADLLSGGETERADWCRRVQGKFLAEHMVNWIPRLCDAVIDKAELPFYAAMAKLAKNVLEFEQQTIGGEVPETV